MMGYKEERHKVSGISHYEKDIVREIGKLNNDYLLSDEELLKKYRKECTVFEYSFPSLKPSLIPEPDNPYDPNAIRIDVNGTKIGYIKKGSCSHVRKLLDDPNYSHCTIEIYGGRRKRIYEFEDGGYDIEEEDDDNNIGAILTIFINDNAVKVSPGDDGKKILGYIAMVLIAAIILILIFAR